jgi:N-acetylmuramic acid 6-phosphate etherase
VGVDTAFIFTLHAMHSMLKTETPSQLHTELDLYTSAQVIDVLVEDQMQAVRAVRDVGPDIARAVDAALERIHRGGRLVYVGAGTSGRLGLLDSVELGPTFSWPSDRAVALLAGGPAAVYVAVEGAEDDAGLGAHDIAVTGVGALDVVILLAASGATPYVLGALQAANSAGALTIGFANNPGAPITLQAGIGILLDTGSEVISGSTRMKAGTAQKIALNAFSSALMVRLHKVYGNLMVDVKASNAKLLRRTIALTRLATQCDEATATQALDACGYHVKVAIVMIRKQLSADAARTALEAAAGNVRVALKTR